MYKSKKILAVVMARGGSKGIKLKNLEPILGPTKKNKWTSTSFNSWKTFKKNKYY